MRRREFLVATMAVAMSRPVRAQTEARPSTTKRIAIFHPSEPPEALSINGLRIYKAYLGELERLGYTEGQNLVVERWSALGKIDRYTDVARLVVGSHPDVIFATGPVTLRLKALTQTIPILCVNADPVAQGIVTNLAKPEGNITGISVDAGLELYGKRLQFLNETVGNLTNVRLLTIAPTLKLAETILARLRETAGPLANTITLAVLSEKLDSGAYERAFDAMEKYRVDGIVVGDIAEHLTYRELIVNLAAKHRLPAIYPIRVFVDVGGLLSYGIDAGDVGRRLADMTDEVLRGTRPGDIPVSQQTKFELVLNQRTARSLGLEFPATVLAGADEVIE
jgi:putative ABC transport system substrate-binding protein